MPERTVLVTGGTKGIGLAVAERFAREGDRVIAVARSEASLKELAGRGGGSLRGELCDITDERGVEELFARVGAVDVLVNNAGVSDSAPLRRTTLEEWRRQLDVNATGPFLCTRAALAGMTERGRGRIVTVASTAARVGARYTAAYTASKHAALGLMRAVAAEVEGTGVTANAVCPTFVRTPMTERSLARIVERTERSEEEALAALTGQSPLGRLLEPAEVAAAVAYLASEDAGAINGQALVLDGGGIQA